MLFSEQFENENIIQKGMFFIYRGILCDSGLLAKAKNTLQNTKNDTLGVKL